MAYLLITPSACIRLIMSRVSFIPTQLNTTKKQATITIVRDRHLPRVRRFGCFQEALGSSSLLLSFWSIHRPRIYLYLPEGNSMETFLQDLKYAIRMLVKKPGFTLVAVLSLTLGIGANTTIFTLAKAVFLQTVSAKDPGNILVVFSSATSRSGPPQQFLPMSYLNARDLRDHNDVFSASSMGVFTGSNITISGKTVNVFCEFVNCTFFYV